MRINLYSSASCPPCKRFYPVWEQLIQENPEVEFVKYSAEDDLKAFMDAGVSSVPTIVVGDHKLVGLQSKESIQKIINEG